METARAVAAAGATILRGGAFKPRTSPYAFQGLGSKGLEILVEAREETGLPIVTELLDPRDVEEVAEVTDVIQIGARNMQNFNLLAEVGQGAEAGAAEAGSCGDGRGAADGRRVRREGGERARAPLRAGDQDLRALDALHARSLGRARAQARDAPAGDRRPVARGRVAATSCSRSPGPRWRQGRTE